MKKLTLLFLAVAITLSIGAQSTGELQSYRRNALATMMVYHSEDEFGKNIYEAFEAIPCPDKYDDHSIGINVIYNDSIHGVQKKGADGLIKAQMGKTLTKSDVEKNAKALENLLNKRHVGRMMAAKWFGLDRTDQAHSVWNGFNMNLIQTRGQYNASDVDVATALLTPRGVATLEDAGEELISNTFVLVNDMTYVTSEEKAAVAKTVISILGGIFDAAFGGHLGETVSDVSGAIADSYTGFDVKTHSYLFQLQWNDSIAAVFYNNYYTTKDNFDIDKMRGFLRNDSLFVLKYVSHAYEYDDKAAYVGKYTREELVKMACTKSMDKNIAVLQANYEDFKVKTPVYELVRDEKDKVTGYAAKIGMKEGITESSKFQVVQRVINPNTNRTTYRYVASLKPVKGQIWDNRYNAVTEKSEGSELPFTLFKKTSGGEILPGMLIIEGKYRKVTE